VRDNGIGFEGRFAPQLFRPSTRQNPRAAFEGAGIGLALCHRGVICHGGTIAAT
jgi:light-regulated signal transduction histidine kinase (bacteriophytochrome)